MGVELADRRLSSDYLELPLTLRECSLRLLRCKPPRHLEPPSGAPQGVLSVVVVLGERHTEREWNRPIYYAHAAKKTAAVDRGDRELYARQNERVSPDRGGGEGTCYMSGLCAGCNWLAGHVMNVINTRMTRHKGQGGAGGRRRSSLLAVNGDFNY